jgi:hypothetical protein
METKENKDYIFPEDVPIGSLIRLTKNSYPFIKKEFPSKGHVVLRTINGFVSLNDPAMFWNNSFGVHGKKLNPGYSFTIISK